MRKIKKSPLPYIMRGGANLLMVATALSIVIGVFKCPIYYFTHIPCPGCGMTRACTSALRLDFKAAFGYHQLFPIPFLWMAYEALRKILKFKKTADVIFFFITCSALFVRWVIIMILHFY